MPLVRYEVRCEHSLANPELYRSAARDDPESLLEGVAMAGLVGIVRQLGDLAEFAAEIFCGLHDELMTIGSRGHDLNMRVQQLEDELPAVERALLSEPNQLRFAYTNGSDWHASIRSDQNHCTSGDLPRFVRNYYEECRGPPQLFLLDKFDVSGVGACLKRYTDPSFFKLEWASTELLRAQREQRDKKARREKKKGRRSKTGHPTAAINQIPARVRYGSASLEDLEGLPHDLASVLKVEIPAPSRLGVNRESSPLTPRGDPREFKTTLIEDNPLPASSTVQVSASSKSSQGKKSVKVGATDPESATVSRSTPNRSESDDTARSSSDRISKIIEQEDRAAAPDVGQTRVPETKEVKSCVELGDAADGVQVLSVDSRVTNGLLREDPEAQTKPRSVRTPVGTPRANARGEFSVDVREGDKHSDNTPRGTDSPMPLRSSRRSAYMEAFDSVRLSGKFLWRKNLDGDDTSPMGGKFSRQVSMARSGISGSEYDEFVDAPSRIGSEGESDFDSPGSLHRATHFNGDALNNVALQNHVESQKTNIPPGMKLTEPPPTPGKLVEISEVVTETKDVQMTENYSDGTVLKSLLAVSTEQDEDFAASATVLRQADISAGYGSVRDQQSEAQKSDNRSGEVLKVQGNGSLDSHTEVVSAIAIPKDAEESDLQSKVIERSSSFLGSLSRSISLSHEESDVLQPSFAVSSRHSISSELISVSSDSEPTSPTSPKSPAFRVLYSPRVSPPRATKNTVKSPPTAYLRSSPPRSHTSNCSSLSVEEVPVLSESPTSFPGSPHRALVPERDSLCPEVVPLKSESLNLASQPGAQLYPLPTPPMSFDRESPSDSRELGSSGIACFGRPLSPQKNGESVNNTSAGEGDHPVLQLSPTVKHDTATRLREPSDHYQPVQPPVVSSNGDVTPRSPHCGTPRYSVFSESTRSSLVLPSRAAESPGSSAPSSPFGSPKKSFQRIFLSSPSALSSPSPLRNSVGDGSSYPRRDENSAPSSPSGSVIIKDSPPESPRSSYNGSECESRDFDAIQGRPETSASAGFFSQVMKETLLKREVDADDVSSIVSLKVQSPQALTTKPDYNLDLLSSSPSHTSSKHPEVAVEIASELSLDSSITEGSADLLVSEKKVSSSGNSFSSPQVDPLPATLKPISTARSTTKSFRGLASSSPPDSPGKEEQMSSVQWRGKAVTPATPPRSTFKLPYQPQLRSPLRSPLHTPRSYFAETGSLKWLGRVDTGLSPKPDFSLPPNLVPHSETSSPACSPPPQLDLDSPTKSIVSSEVSENLGSARTTVVHHFIEDEKEKGNLLPDSPNASSVTSFVNAGHFSPLRRYIQDDYDEGYVAPNMCQRVVPNATNNSDPSYATSSLVEDVPCFEAVVVKESNVFTRKAEIEQLSFSGGGVVSNESFPTTSWSAASSPEKENGIRFEQSCEVDVYGDDAAHALQRPGASSSRGAEDGQELEIARDADLDVRSSDSKQGSLFLSDESESRSQSIDAIDTRLIGAAQLNQDASDLYFAVHDHEESSPFEERASGQVFEPADGSGVSRRQRQSDDHTLPSISTPEPESNNDPVCWNSTDATAEAQSVKSQESKDKPGTHDALTASIALHDRNSPKVPTLQVSTLRPPPPDERTLFRDQMRTSSFNLRRTDSMEKKETVHRPVANINVAAILEKANAIRQAFAGSDDDDDGDDDWSDS